MDVEIDGHKYVPYAQKLEENMEAVKLLRGLHDKYHGSKCCCVVADFLASFPAQRNSEQQK